MKATNYQLFDFLDFNPAMDGRETLWRACKPTAIREEAGAVIIYVPFQKQNDSNEITPDTSTPPVEREIRIEAVSSHILRVMLEAGTEISRTSPMLELSPELKAMPLHVEQTGTGWLIKDSDGTKRAEVDLKDPAIEWWSDLQPGPRPTIRLTLWPDGKHEVPFQALDSFSPARHDAFAFAYAATDGKVDRMTCSFAASHDECFAGTGERFTKMDLSGQTMQLRNQDGQGVNNRRTYKSIPFYLSSKGYGVFLHTTDFAKFSLADHSRRSAQIFVEDARLDLFVMADDTPERILYHYRSLTGFPEVPPLWSYGIWMSRMTYFSAEEVEGICRRLREEHWPCDVIHLDTGWFRTDWLCEWKFNDERFPEPEKFIHRLLDDGFKVSLWQLPYISYGAAQYKEAVEKNYIGKSERKIGGASNFSSEDYAGTIDFTNPEATEWYKGLLRNLLDMGVKCIKTDFGEDIHMDAEYNGMSAKQLRNLYPLLYQKAAAEVTKEVTGDTIIWARSSWAGSQRYPVHWGGDSAGNWEGLAGSLKGGLHLGLSGFAFWSHDIPGFHSLPDFMNSPIPQDIYVRWTQFGVFTSHMRYHGSHPREPWLFPEVAPIVKDWWNLRYKLIPYIEEQGRKCARTGYPMTRALLFHHPDDPFCWHIDDEYYFGDDFLVAPVMNAEGLRDIYLPEGKWVDFFTREEFEGGRLLKGVKTPLERMPVFVRKGAVIPMYPEAVDSTDDMDLSKTTTVKY